MMYSSSLNNKLKSYSALASSIALMSSQSDAQIIYTDINPDTTVNISGNFYNLDLDNDGTFDFKFDLFIDSSSSYIFQQVSVSPAGSNSVAGDTVGAYIYPLAINSGDTIKSSLQFNTGAYQSMASYSGAGSTFGNWYGKTDKFIGLRFFIGSQIHYGWARLDVNATATQFTVKDYAYNATPNAYIIAGDGMVGIHENAFDQSISIYNSNKNIVVKFINEVIIEGKIVITNALGQEIHSSALTDIETRINLTEEKTGIYFVTIVQKNGNYTKKVLLN